MPTLLFFLGIILLSLPCYKFLSWGQIIFYGLLFILIFYKYTNAVIKKNSLNLKWPSIISTVMLLALAFSLKKSLSWEKYLPILLLVLYLSYITYLFASKKRDELFTIKGLNLNKPYYIIIFVLICFSLILIPYLSIQNLQYSNFLFTKAEANIKKGKVNDSIFLLKKAINLKPNLFKAYLALCSIYYRDGNYDKVIQTSRQAISQSLASSEYYELFNFYITSSYFKKNDFKNALIFLKYTTALDKDNSIQNVFQGSIEYSFYKGMEFFLNQKFDLAIDKFKEYLLIESNNDVSFMLAKTYFLQKHYKQALEIFEKLLNEGFKNADIYFICAEIYLHHNNLDKSIEMLDNISKQGLLTDANSERLSSDYLKITAILEKNSKINQVIDLYSRMIKIPKIKESGILNLAKIYLKLERIDDTLSLLSNIKIDSKIYPETALLLGDTYNKLKKYKIAKKYYLVAISKDPNNLSGSRVEATIKIGMIYEVSGNLNRAIAWYKKLKYVYPGKMYQHISLAYLNAGKIDKALNTCNSGYNNKILREQAPYCFLEVYTRLLPKYQKIGSKDTADQISKKILILKPKP